MEYSERPWGSYQVLDEGTTYKVKRIVVKPGKRLSLQRHSKRSEHWLIISGHARITINDSIQDYSIETSVDIAIGDAHRVENIGAEDLIFIEVQTGTYFGEDDIERLEDDFGRAS